YTGYRLRPQYQPGDANALTRSQSRALAADGINNVAVVPLPDNIGVRRVNQSGRGQVGRGHGGVGAQGQLALAPQPSSTEGCAPTTRWASHARARMTWSSPLNRSRCGCITRPPETTQPRRPRNCIARTTSNKHP